MDIELYRKMKIKGIQMIQRIIVTNGGRKSYDSFIQNKCKD